MLTVNGRGLFTLLLLLLLHPFNGPLSWTTRVSQYQKGKTNLDFTEARDSEWQWHQLGHMQVCTSLQTDNHTSTPPLSFYRPDALPVAQPTASKYLNLKWLFIVLFSYYMHNLSTVLCSNCCSHDFVSFLIPPALSDEVLVWLSIWSEVQIVCIWSSWCHSHPKTPSSLASFKSRLVLLF